MKNKVLFVCETCGYENEDHGKVTSCEAHHQQPADIVTAKYEKSPDMLVNAYPKYIAVAFPDGSRYQYQCSHMVKHPD